MPELVPTIYCVPKPFVGRFDVIQRNAIASWTRLEPRPEIILMGDETGVGDVSRDLDLIHVPTLRRNELGTPFIDDIFDKAEVRASYNVVAYLNADIILFQNFIPAVRRAAEFRRAFLMIGKKHDLEIKQLVDFRDASAVAALIERTRNEGVLCGPEGVDYYVFTKGLFGDIPPFVIGRQFYDNWLIWRARSRGVDVIDSTAAVTCLHQRHDRTFASMGKSVAPAHDDFRKGTEARANFRLAGKNLSRLYNLMDSTHVMTKDEIRVASDPEYARMRKVRRLQAQLSADSDQEYLIFQRRNH